MKALAHNDTTTRRASVAQHGDVDDVIGGLSLAKGPNIV